MPIARLINEQTTDYQRLKEQLQEEWAAPTNDPTRPAIIETNDPLRLYVVPEHLYIIWNAWGNMPQQKRSEMIMEVYAAVKGRPAAMNVTIAMGLTTEEAKEVGISWETVN